MQIQGKDVTARASCRGDARLTHTGLSCCIASLVRHVGNNSSRIRGSLSCTCPPSLCAVLGFDWICLLVRDIQLPRCEPSPAHHRSWKARSHRVRGFHSISNSLRVVKTYRQVNATHIGYMCAARAVSAADGVKGLFGRGLKTRILANGLQGIVFSVLWKLLLDL